MARRALVAWTWAPAPRASAAGQEAGATVWPGTRVPQIGVAPVTSASPADERRRAGPADSRGWRL